MLLCNFCEEWDCEYYPEDDECKWNGDDEKIIEYAQEHGISISDAVALIKFCCGMR